MQKLPNLYLSQRLDLLVDCLIYQMSREEIPPLGKRILLVPNGYFKDWLLLEIAKRKGIAMGLKVFALSEGMQFLSQGSFPNALELFALLFSALSEYRDPDLLSYLDGKKKRLHDLSAQLSTLFSNYGQFGPSLFDPNRKTIDWQHELLRKLFVEGPWKMPAQTLGAAEVRQVGPIHCFGIDFLPSLFWEYLFRHEPFSIYLFSPCIHFWGDLCSDRERRYLMRDWKGKKVSHQVRLELDDYLREAPSLLANWGKLGRETLKILDRFDFETKEAYLEVEENTLLQKVQSRLLYFQTGEALLEGLPEDNSIQVSLTGSSRLREIEVVRDQILSLVARSGLLFHEIAILAPDIEPYAPLIEFVFNEPESSIPYRISGLDIGAQSSFFQGLVHLSHLALGRWEAETVLALFETKAFYQSQGWDHQKLELYREWIVKARIEWGIDETHRQTILEETLGGTPSTSDRGSWKKGLDLLLERLIYLYPEGSSLQGLEIGADHLEEWVSILFSLNEDLAPFQKREESLAFWADCLEKIGKKYLLPDLTNEADSAAFLAFQRLLSHLRQAESRLNGRFFPFTVIHRFLIRPCTGQIHASHLHAVRIASFEEAASLPAKALFLIGMDEESFPRIQAPSSLDLLRREKIAVPDHSSWERYLFLQALFAAGEFLRISYGHLSADEGKPVGPSLLVQELLSSIKTPLQFVYPSLSFDIRCFDPTQEKIQSFSKSDYRAALALYGPKRTLSFWPALSKAPSPVLPQGELTIAISSLSSLSRHPWKFYLQNVHGMFLNESLEESFALQKSQALRTSLTQSVEKTFLESEKILPAGLLGEALRLEIGEKANEWREQMENWELDKPISIHFQDNCRVKHLEKGIGGERLASPPLELSWENGLKVRLVGEVKLASLKGLIHIGGDDIGGLLKIWPGALIVAIALDAPRIFCLKSGKIKDLEQMEEALKKFLEYYFVCLSSPSPLLPDWADALLRKGANELEKKIDVALSGSAMFEDPFIQWVLARADIPLAEKIDESWAPYLKETFSHLTALYPYRGARATI